MEQFEIDLNRLAREITFEVQHSLLLVEPRRFRELRRDHRHGREIDFLRLQVGKNLGEARGGVRLAKPWRAHIAQHREVAVWSAC